MTIEGFQWLLMLMFICFILGTIFGPRLIRWLINLPKYFLRPNYLKLVGYLRSEDGKSKIRRRR